MCSSPILRLASRMSMADDTKEKITKFKRVLLFTRVICISQYIRCSYLGGYSPTRQSSPKETTTEFRFG
ncbi:hypothetical protein VNO78_28657 [Psophocarpus tetragonolobus]|uniref:Uncharacterized protein n=1 Tax=Psophocarpus tetragonolobus TaxID=3891 RepID=A0AAN9WYM1_PSOTE